MPQGGSRPPLIEIPVAIAGFTSHLISPPESTTEQGFLNSPTDYSSA